MIIAALSKFFLVKLRYKMVIFRCEAISCLVDKWMNFARFSNLKVKLIIRLRSKL